MGDENMKSVSRLPNGENFVFWERKPRYTTELHVDCGNPEADDGNNGSRGFPLKTIQAAAERAIAGTRVLIHAGEYRECVKPKRGGDGPEAMICYEAFGDGAVLIKASEVITEFEPSVGWRRSAGFGGEDNSDNCKIWRHCLSPGMFQGYNPFCAVNILHDRLFIEYDKTDMTTYLNRRGVVYCDGAPLTQVPLYNRLTASDSTYWVEANGQTIHFRLKDDGDPNDHLIEISCREQCFAPDVPFLSYIKVKGLTFSHAANGAPVPQRGAVSCCRGHHWIIEDCEIAWSNAVGIDVGNECWHHEFMPGQQVGHSVIRGCRILDTGVCGIAGLYATHMLIEDNLIEGTGWQKMELSWEAAGIKLHNSIDGLFRRNIFKRTYRADHLWLDVGNENNRVTQNLFLDGIEQREAIFIECSRDAVNLIDNNIIWNVEGRFDESKIPAEPGSSGWYKQIENDIVNGYGIYGEGTDRLHIVNNLIGKCRSAGYYAKPVSFRMGGMMRGGTSRDAHILNNIFYECGEAAMKLPTEKNTADGNLYVKLTGGYLRILYPAPEVCLDLPAWKEFYGFDSEGAEGWFDISLDTESYLLTVSGDAIKPQGRRWALAKREFVYEPGEVRAVTSIVNANTDFYGDDAAVEGKRIPGPFVNLATGGSISVDPRSQAVS
jgi:hypothetical protein